MIKQCVICLKKFKARNNLQKCCSKICSKEYNKQYDKQYQKLDKYKKWHNKYQTLDNYKKYRNSDKWKELQKKYSKSDKRKAYVEKYNKSDKRKNNQKLYYNSDKYKNHKKQYLQSEHGKEVKRLTTQRYRAKRNNIEHCFTQQQWLDKINKTKGICFECGKFVGINKLTLDHIFPVHKADIEFNITGIKRKYYIDDIQPLCKSCNSSKRDKLIAEVWMNAFNYVIKIYKEV